VSEGAGNKGKKDAAPVTNTFSNIAKAKNIRQKALLRGDIAGEWRSLELADGTSYVGLGAKSKPRCENEVQSEYTEVRQLGGTKISRAPRAPAEREGLENRSCHRWRVAAIDPLADSEQDFTGETLCYRPCNYGAHTRHFHFILKHFHCPKGC